MSIDCAARFPDFSLYSVELGGKNNPCNYKFGAAALELSQTTGNPDIKKNQAFGQSAGNALNSNAAGAVTESNIAIGAQALAGALTTSNNVAVGANALRSLTSGSKNIAVGYNAASQTTSTGTNNVIIGSNTQLANNLSYCVAIGTGAQVKTDNTIVLGGPSNKSAGQGGRAGEHLV